MLAAVSPDALLAGGITVTLTLAGAIAHVSWRQGRIQQRLKDLDRRMDRVQKTAERRRGKRRWW